MTELNAIQGTLPLNGSSVELIYYSALPPHLITKYLEDLHHTQNIAVNFFYEQKEVLEGIVESSRDILLEDFIGFYFFERDHDPSDLEFQKELELRTNYFNKLENRIKDDSLNLEIYGELSDFLYDAKLRLNKLGEKELSDVQITSVRRCCDSLDILHIYLDDLVILIEDLIDLRKKTQRVDVLSLLY